MARRKREIEEFCTSSDYAPKSGGAVTPAPSPACFCGEMSCDKCRATFLDAPSLDLRKEDDDSFVEASKPMTPGEVHSAIAPSKPPKPRTLRPPGVKRRKT